MSFTSDREPNTLCDAVPFATFDDEAIAARETQSPAAALAAAFPRLRPSERTRVLRHLLLPIGPLALAALGRDFFAKYARQDDWSGMPLSAEEVARVTPAQVRELVRYVEQSAPEFVHRVLGALARDAAAMDALGASAATVVLRHAAPRGARGRGEPRRFLPVRVPESLGHAARDRKRPAPKGAVVRRAGSPVVRTSRSTG